jgi:hypothetical protein
MYCVDDPHVDDVFGHVVLGSEGSRVKGADIVAESLGRICIWSHYGKRRLSPFFVWRRRKMAVGRCYVR